LLHAIAAPEGYLVAWQGQSYRFTRPQPLTVEATAGSAGGSAGAGALTAPMPGTIIKVLATEGERVGANAPLLILEAMKMEHTIAAPHAGTVRRLPFGIGAVVAAGATLAEIDHDGSQV
jgi:3-methylcrotonyl-CoA carboxylase alpha subunit